MKRISEAIQQSVDVKQKILEDNSILEAIREIAETCSQALCLGNKILFCGNGEVRQMRSILLQSSQEGFIMTARHWLRNPSLLIPLSLQPLQTTTLSTMYSPAC